MAKKRVSTSIASITAVVVACHATLDYINEYCVTGKNDGNNLVPRVSLSWGEVWRRIRIVA